MIGKITPLVQVAGQRAWTSAVAFHIVGLLVSSSALGLLLGMIANVAVGALPTGIVIVSWAFAGLWFALVDLGVAQRRPPEFVRQTPGRWDCVFGRNAGAFLWGLDLGQGWTVRIPFTAFYSLLLWPVVLRSPFLSMLTFALYGLGKGLPLIWARVNAHRPDTLSIACANARPLAALFLGVIAAVAVGLVLAQGALAVSGTAGVRGL